MIINLNGLHNIQGRPSPLGCSQRSFGVVANHIDEAKATGGGVLTKAEIPDPLGIRKKYAEAPEVIQCSDRIWQAVEEFNKRDGEEPLNLAGADLGALGNITDKKNSMLSLERYILSLGAQGQYPLDGAHLQRAILDETNLAEAYLEGADLTGAHLNGTNLYRARLTRAHLKEAYLKEAYLKGADLNEAHLEGADLKGANLIGAYLGGAYLEGADLTGANLTGANLQGANLQGANLTRAKLLGAVIGADLQGANLIEAYVYKDNNKITGNELKKYLKKEFPYIVNLDSATFE